MTEKEIRYKLKRMSDILEKNKPLKREDVVDLVSAMNQLWALYLSQKFLNKNSFCLNPTNRENLNAGE